MSVWVHFIWGEFYEFIILFNIILVSLSVILFNLFVRTNIKERLNDIAIFKSLGLEDFKIIKVFLPINIFCSIIYVILSLTGGMLMFYYLNERLALSMNISYHIFNYEIFTFIFILILSFLIFSYSILITIQRIVKLDPWSIFRQIEKWKDRLHFYMLDMESMKPIYLLRYLIWKRC
jgi:ABC-type lipoprotein release transport system permease subunit